MSNHASTFLLQAGFLASAVAAFTALGTALALSGCEGSATQTTNDPGIHGVLVDSEGNPAPGVRVSAWRGSLPLQERPIGSGNSPDAVQSTDAEGRFSFTQLESGIFNVFSETETSAHAEYGIAFDDKAVDLGRDTLRQPGVLIGRVVANGLPLADVFCFIPKSPYIAMTDSSGRFQLPSVPKGVHRLRYVHEGFSTVEDSGLILVGGDTLWLPDRVLKPNLSLQPPTPTGLAAKVDTNLGIVFLAWDSVPVADLDRYVIEAKRAGKSSETFVLIGESDSTGFVDRSFRGRFTQKEGLNFGVVDTVTVTYRVRARDKDGNFSPNYSKEIALLLSRPRHMRVTAGLTEREGPQDTVSCRDTLVFEASFSSPSAPSATFSWRFSAVWPSAPIVEPKPTKDIYNPSNSGRTKVTGERDVLSWTWGQGWNSTEATYFADAGKPDSLKVELWIETGSGDSLNLVRRMMDVEMPSIGCYRVHASRDPYLWEAESTIPQVPGGWRKE